MNFDRDRATHLADTARRAVFEKRWTQDVDAQNALCGLERALSISIQGGQPGLVSMQEGLIASYAQDLLTHARAAYGDHAIAEPTLADEQMFGTPRARIADIIDVRQPLGEVVDVSYLRRRAAIAA